MLFLLGGDINLIDTVAEEFIPSAGGPNAIIALLLSGDKGWENHVTQYVQPLIKQGVSQCYTIAPDKSGTLDQDKVIAILRKATGIFIGGGDTTTYHQLYSSQPFRSTLRNRYRDGVPVVGFSSGALIIPEICAIPPEDTGDNRVKIVPGLGLVNDLIIGVHYTEWNALPHMVEVMVETRTNSGLGIDGTACAVFDNGEIKRVIGRSVYNIKLTDFESKTYEVTNAA